MVSPCRRKPSATLNSRPRTELFSKWVDQRLTVSPPISDEISRLVRSLFEKRSLFDRVRRQDHRFLTLKQIAESREIRVVPTLLPLVAADDTLAPHVAAVIAELVRDATAVQLSWLDEQVRLYLGTGPGSGVPPCGRSPDWTLSAPCQRPSQQSLTTHHRFARRRSPSSRPMQAVSTSTSSVVGSARFQTRRPAATCFGCSLKRRSGKPRCCCSRR